MTGEAVYYPNLIGSGFITERDTTCPKQVEPKASSNLLTDIFTPFTPAYEDIKNAQYAHEPVPPSLCQNIFKGLLNFGRCVWKVARELNPLTHLFNLIEKIRCSGHIEKAKERNGARTNEEIKKYHESIQYDGEDTSRIFRTNIADQKSDKGNTKDETVTVLFLGNKQSFKSPKEKAGLNEFYEKLAAEGHKVIQFRVGDAASELKHWCLLSNDCSLNTDFVFENTSNILEDLIKGRGVFTGVSKPKKIVFVGYSFGGGTTQKLLNERWEKIGGNTPVSTVYLDPIKLGTTDLGCPVDERPTPSSSHMVFYQNNSTAINGSAPLKLEKTDTVIELPNDTHNSVDNNPYVQKIIHKLIEE